MSRLFRFQLPDISFRLLRFPLSDISLNSFAQKKQGSSGGRDLGGNPSGRPRAESLIPMPQLPRLARAIPGKELPMHF